jgi:hypothetical protein
MDNHNLELKLEMKPGIAKGEIRFSDVHRLCETLQELNTRISRLVTGQEGPGRSPEATARASELRLTSISGGSTLLGVGYGEPNTLPAPEFSRLEDETYDKFMQIMEGMRDNHCPDWVTPGIAESTLRVADTFENIAQAVVINRSQGEPVGIWPIVVHRAPWQKVIKAAVTDQQVTVSGVLYAVNLETRRFGIRDDVGNTIGLEEVQNTEAAGDLIGNRATASGLGVRGPGGELRAVRAALVQARAMPREWVAPRRQNSLESELAKPGPDPRGVEGITSEDVDEFLALIHG